MPGCATSEPQEKPAPQSAEPQGPSLRCGPRTQFLDTLTRRYGEALVALGLAGNGAMMELYATGDGATWTLVISPSGEISCLLAAGENWRARPGPGA